MMERAAFQQRAGEGAHAVHAGVQEERPHQRFEGGAEQRRSPGAASLGFAAPQAHRLAQVDQLGESRQGFGAHQRRAHPGEVALAHLGVLIIQPGADQKIEHRITQKFQALVVFQRFGVFVEE